MNQPLIRHEEHHGAPVSAADRSVTPVSRALILELPRLGGTPRSAGGAMITTAASGGVLWNRPSSVIVRDSEGAEERLPIPDITRIAQVLILGFGALASTLMWIALRPRTDKTGHGQPA